MSFKDKVVLVTGGSSGIGASIAIQFAKEGAKVVVVGRNESKLKDVAQKCEKNGSKPLVIVADVTKDDDVKRIIGETLKQFRKLDVLINNAGAATAGSILDDNALEDFDKMITTNLRSAVYLSNLAAPHLVETKGNIINISSIAALSPLSSRRFSYCTSKAGMDHFTRCIALELAPKGVRVNVVNPGPVKTDIIYNTGANEHYEKLTWDLLLNATALKRISEPEEVSDLVLFLASDKAKGITGSSFVTDNGALLKGTMER